jgi:hypothetical protein
VPAVGRIGDKPSPQFGVRRRVGRINGSGTCGLARRASDARNATHPWTGWRLSRCFDRWKDTRSSNANGAATWPWNATTGHLAARAGSGRYLRTAGCPTGPSGSQSSAPRPFSTISIQRARLAQPRQRRAKTTWQTGRFPNVAYKSLCSKERMSINRFAPRNVCQMTRLSHGVWPARG